MSDIINQIVKVLKGLIDKLTKISLLIHLKLLLMAYE